MTENMYFSIWIKLNSSARDDSLLFHFCKRHQIVFFMSVALEIQPDETAV